MACLVRWLQQCLEQQCEPLVRPHEEGTRSALRVLCPAGESEDVRVHSGRSYARIRLILIVWLFYFRSLSFQLSYTLERRDLILALCLFDTPSYYPSVLLTCWIIVNASPVRVSSFSSFALVLFLLKWLAGRNSIAMPGFQWREQRKRRVEARFVIPRQCRCFRSLFFLEGFLHTLDRKTSLPVHARLRPQEMLPCF